MYILVARRYLYQAIDGDINILTMQILFNNVKLARNLIS